jgi:hypothetical protein
MTGRPDFFIAGAPKCGTTALFAYLSQHASVFMPRIKEPKFFCTDLRTNGGVYAPDEYRALFAPAPAQCVTGEASTLYLYSKVAIERIMAYNPDAKIIVMLRYPVDAAHSLHAAGWSHKVENIEDFEDAWRLQAARLSGEHMPPRWPDAATLQYGAIYSYAAQVRRVLEHVPEQQRHFVVYEDFFADAPRHYAEILYFLRLTPNNPTAFGVINPAVGSRSRRVEGLLREPPQWLKTLYAPIRPLFHAAGLHPAGIVWGLNSVPRQKSALRPAFRAELDRYFSNDIAELERLLGRRLWRQSS